MPRRRKKLLAKLVGHNGQRESPYLRWAGFLHIVLDRSRRGGLMFPRIWDISPPQVGIRFGPSTRGRVDVCHGVDCKRGKVPGSDPGEQQGVRKGE